MYFALRLLTQGQTLLREIAALQGRLDQERTQRSFVQSAIRDSKDEVSGRLQEQVRRTACTASVAHPALPH